MKRFAGAVLCAIAVTVGLIGVAAPVIAAGAASDDPADRVATHTPGAATDEVAGRIKRTLEARLPNLQIDAVEPAPVPGIYEIFAGDQIAYSDPTGNYLFVGHMMDTRNRRDLSADQVDAHLAIDFHKLPFSRAIKIVKGNGKRRLALFADPDCPYCHQLEQSLKSVSDVTIYLFLYPLETVHPHATVHAREIWCSPDRASAWRQWMLEGKPPPGTACKGDPIDELHALGASLHINSTPTMFLENGRRVGGAIPAADLEKLLAQASSRVAQLPAARGAGG